MFLSSALSGTQITELEILTGQSTHPDFPQKREDSCLMLFEEAAIGLFQSSPEGQALSMTYCG